MPKDELQFCRAPLIDTSFHTAHFQLQYQWFQLLNEVDFDMFIAAFNCTNKAFLLKVPPNYPYDMKRKKFFF